MTSHWQRMFLVSALSGVLLSGYVVGCGVEGPRPGDEVSAPPPAVEISASPESTRATEGVERWQIHDSDDELSMRLVGVDRAGQVIADAQLHVEIGADGALTGILLEGVFPEHGMIRLAADGTITTSTIPEDGVSVRTMGALVTDLATFDDAAGDKHPRSLSCTLAKAQMVLKCAGAVVACILSGGDLSVCVSGAGACYNAVMNYRCKCKGKC